MYIINYNVCAQNLEINKIVEKQIQKCTNINRKTNISKRYEEDTIE